jgi:Flp pilus assembly pilin Flp
MIYNNKKGIALITTLLLALISLALIATLMNLVLSGTKMSGIMKTYTSTVEAAKGGVEKFISDMGPYVYGKGKSTDTTSICKIQQDTANWGVICKGYMKDKGYSVEQLSSHSSINDIVKYYDDKLNLGNYSVYVKIVDTRGASNNWFYTIETVAVSNNKKQKAWYTVVIRTD